ncbi:hypothetical protein BJ741DRAFT_626243 [Chytriomyces cf. hyalinus JEL632]|nr:hypothetical protein BJ741DRAFT_626243 [Chytriomyces cf. hyalinus JEL632]
MPSRIILATLTASTALAQTLSGYGADCQPSVPSATRCGGGFTCVLSNPGLPGGKGLCHAVSKIGQSCAGGSIQFPAVCEDVATCVMPAAVAGAIQQGTCKAAAATSTVTADATKNATTQTSKAPAPTNLKSGAVVAFAAGLVSSISLFFV